MTLFDSVFILGIMRINAIASATREKQFAAHLINEETKIIFLDEWTSDSLNAEDAKKVQIQIQTQIELIKIVHFCSRVFPVVISCSL